MELWTFIPEDVTVSIGAFYFVEGFSEGTFIEVSKDIQPLVTVRSTDGQVARRRVINDTYTIKLTVLRASAANNALTRLWKLDELTDQGKFPILIKDHSGTGYFFSKSAWVENIPSLQYSTSMESNTWLIRANDGVLNIGGNQPLTDLQNIADLSLSGLPYIERLLSSLG
jgi:hypothetical protein